jgi:hypothetical protein
MIPTTLDTKESDIHQVSGSINETKLTQLSTLVKTPSPSLTTKAEERKLERAGFVKTETFWCILDSFRLHSDQHIVRVPPMQWVDSRKLYRERSRNNHKRRSASPSSFSTTSTEIDSPSQKEDTLTFYGKWVYVESKVEIPIGTSVPISIRHHYNKRGEKITTYKYQGE